MQADPSAQRALLLIADLDTQTAQLRHRKATLPEHAKLAELAGKRGQLSDLRDSGEIEQAADVVIFLYREELYQPDTPNKGVIEMIVRKNRHGGLGTAYGLAAFDVSRIDDQPRGFRPAIVQAPSTARARFQEGSPFTARARFQEGSPF